MTEPHSVLSKRPEAVKILILVSDGQPADSGYGGSAAEEDLRGIKQEYQRKGILFVAAAIGDDSVTRSCGKSAGTKEIERNSSLLEN